MAIDSKKFKKQLEKTLRDTVKELQSRQNMTQLGKSLADDIKKRTQLGYGVTRNGGSRERLEPLSKSYVEQRRGKLAFRTNNQGKAYAIDPKKPEGKGSKLTRKKNKEFVSKNKIQLSGKTTPKKSNLTQTGRMIRSIGVLVTGIGKVIIGFNTQKRAQIAAFVSKARPFFFATDKEQKRLVKRVQKKFNDLIRRNIRKNF